MRVPFDKYKVQIHVTIIATGKVNELHFRFIATPILFARLVPTLKMYTNFEELDSFDCYQAVDRGLVSWKHRGGSGLCSTDISVYPNIFLVMLLKIWESY